MLEFLIPTIDIQISGKWSRSITLPSTGQATYLKTCSRVIHLPLFESYACWWQIGQTQKPQFLQTQWKLKSVVSQVSHSSRTPFTDRFQTGVTACVGKGAAKTFSYWEVCVWQSVQYMYVPFQFLRFIYCMSTQNIIWRMGTQSRSAPLKWKRRCTISQTAVLFWCVGSYVHNFVCLILVMIHYMYICIMAHSLQLNWLGSVVACNIYSVSEHVNTSRFQVTCRNIHALEHIHACAYNANINYTVCVPLTYYTGLTHTACVSACTRLHLINCLLEVLYQMFGILPLSLSNPLNPPIPKLSPQYTFTNLINN